MPNSFGSRSTLKVGAREYEIHRLSALEKAGLRPGRLPFSLRILLENLLRTEDGRAVKDSDVRALATWDAKAEPSKEIAFMPARVLLQDFTGVPAVVDLAAMRAAIKKLGGDATRINPLIPAELVIDHSVQVDEFGSDKALSLNAQIEFSRNKERYAFLRWGQSSFRNFSVVPPDTGIVHQVNLEYLARVVFTTPPDQGGQGGLPRAYPDTVVGTDSHTTMVNGLGVLGWGVGGIEAEAAMLGQPMSMLIPQVLGMRLHGKLREGTTATDLVLTVTEILRKKGVVGKFVEFFGPGVAALALADRATIANMAPEYGATCGIFPVDAETLRYLAFSGRPAEQVALVEAYAREQGLFHEASTPEAEYSDVVDLDLASVEPSVAGPKRPQDRVSLYKAKKSFEDALPSLAKPKKATAAPAEEATSDAVPEKRTKRETSVGFAPLGDRLPDVNNGSVVIAAITSCTNTSNPSVLIAAGLVAKKAVEKGLSTKPWVKTSLAPGSKVVTEYLAEAGLQPYLDTLRFNTVGYGCTTCIGNSGPLPGPVTQAIEERALVVCSVLSGNRNFEGRVHPEVRANYLMSPPLVVAYALAGRIDIDLEKEPLGEGTSGPVWLKDIWPSAAEVADAVGKAVKPEMFTKSYNVVFKGDDRWQKLSVPTGDTYVFEDDSTYIKHPPYFAGIKNTPGDVHELRKVRVLAVLGDSITTDHISPAGSIKKDGPAGKYLVDNGVDPKDFNSYGARRGNHEVMVRGTFANVRLKNLLAPGTEGGVTRHLPDGAVMSIFDASEIYSKEGVPLCVLAGKEYGSGSSRDWAAKGPLLLGVRMVIAESYERIHRSNLVGMGILPLQFSPGENVAALGLTGEEVFETIGLPKMLEAGFAGGKTLTVRATSADGKVKDITAVVRIDTPQEIAYYQHGGILHYVLRSLA
jgi:aconitate hydratase